MVNGYYVEVYCTQVIGDVKGNECQPMPPRNIKTALFPEEQCRDKEQRRLRTWPKRAA